MSKILVVEDNEELADNISIWLKNEQHNVDWVNDGVEAIRYLKAYEYDAIVLDWTLPRMTGIEILKQFRANGGVTPVLMLTGRRDIEDKESGFGAGADDYLTKPFEMRELSLRLKNILRRPVGTAPTEHLKARNIVLDKAARRVTKNGQEVRLMPKDYAILELLMTYPNKVFSPESLIDRIWSSDEPGSPDQVRKHINRIRTQIDDDGTPSMIRTVHGIGYSLDVGV